jgi:regulator of protease activity HflC (stomatin/prohibitin superfamily)
MPTLSFRTYAIIAISALVIFYLLTGITGVDPGEVGVLMKQFGADKGMQTRTLSAGTHWIDPISYDVSVYDTRLSQRALVGDDAIDSGTSDGQPITVDVSFQVGLIPEGVPSLHENVGPDWWERVVLPMVRATVRNETSKVGSDDVYTGVGRDAIQAAVSSVLSERLNSLGIRIETNLRDVTFQNAEFVAVLEEKAEAEQRQEINRRQAAAAIEEANRMRNIAEGERFKVEQQAQAEREKRRLEGEGQRLAEEERAKGILAVATAEAEGIRLRNAALAGPGGNRIVEMEWARNLSPKLQVYGFPTGAPGTQSFIIDQALRGGISVPAGGN